MTLLLRKIYHYIFLFHLLAPGLCIGQSFSQRHFAYNTIEQLKWDVFIDHKYNLDEFLKGVEGSPYSDNKYYSGKVYYRGVDNYKEYEMRYNNFLDEIEVLSKDTLKIFQNKRAIEKIQLENQVIFRVFPYKRNGTIIYGFYEEIDSGNINFYKRIEIHYLPAEAPQAGYDEYKPARFKKQPVDFYIQFPDNLPKKVPNSKKKFIKYCTEHNVETSEYLNNHKLKLNEKGIKEFAEYINNQ